MTTRYSDQELSWLAENYRYGTFDDTVSAFEAEFGRKVSRSSLRSKANDMGLRKDSTMGQIGWTPERVAWFRSFVPGHTEPEIAAEFERIFGQRMTRPQLKNAKTRFGVRSGTTGGRFEEGQEAWNKGKAWDEFMSPESQKRSLATCYKKGNMPHNAVGKPIGTERICKDGYTWVKIAERPSRKDCNDNWIQKHRLIWEREHGPIPDGHMIIFLDGDKRNFDIANLAIESRSEHAVIARSHIPFHDAETHEIARAIAKMKSVKYSAKRRMK